MDQWGVGRKGFDDGLVILFDLNENDPCHGQVQLYAGPGLSGDVPVEQRAPGDLRERHAAAAQAVRPRRRAAGGDAEGRRRGDPGARRGAQLLPARSTPSSGCSSRRSCSSCSSAAALLAWFRHGRDPVYLDDPSIHIPAPPVGLTPAAGALVRDGKSSRRALTAASLDLAARGLIGFEAAADGAARPDDRAVDPSPRPRRPPTRSRWRGSSGRARARPTTRPTFLLQRLHSIGGAAGLIDHTELLKLGTDVSGFDKRLEEHVVSQGWFTEPPAKATGRWVGRGVLAIIGGAIGAVRRAQPAVGRARSSLGGALIAAGIVMLILVVEHARRARCPAR